MKENNINNNTIYNAIKAVAAICFPLISYPYVSRVLLTESIGKINFGNSVVSYFSLIASLGISTYAVRECAKVRNDGNALNHVASQIYSINMATTLIAYLLLGLTLLVAKPLHEYRFLIVLQSAVILFATIGADWINTAMEDFRFITIRTVFFQVLSLVLMFLFVHETEDYLIYAAISVFCSVATNVVNAFYRRKYCRIKLTKDMSFKHHIKPILLLFAMILAQTIYCNSDITMIGLFWGDHQVGLYSTAVRIYTIVNTMVASVAYVVMPKLSYAFVRADYKEINKLLRYGTNFIVVLGLPCLVGITVTADGIVNLIAGPEYAEAAPSLQVLVISLAASFIGGIQGNLILIPSGREKICLWASVVSAVVNVVLNLILIPRFGIVAAAATTATAEIVGVIIRIPYIEKEVNLGDIKSIILAPACGCISVVAIAVLMNVLIEVLILRTILTILLSAVGYLVVLIVMKHEFTLNFLRKKI